MAIRDLKARISRLPEQPGVYIYLDRAGETIYVGRARSLKERVRSYITSYGVSPKTDALLNDITNLEIIVTDSLVEALVLENNLIKQRLPRYNILLRDDKNYPYLQLTTDENFPRVVVARSVARDRNFYAGPFLPASFARRTMSLTHRLFGIRSCNEIITGKRDRPCLEYDIKRCIAPCVEELCSQSEYMGAVQRTQLFLEGRNKELIIDLRQQMQDASDEQRYEQAAQIRDSIRTIETLGLRQQKMATVRLGDRDAFGIKIGPAGTVIQVFQVRGGKVVERIELVTDGVEAIRDQEAEVVRVAVQQFYEIRDVPMEVHVPVELNDQETLNHWLSVRAGRRVHLYVPKRGDKRRLLDLATRNAMLAYSTRYSETAQIDSAALDELQRVLELSTKPNRVECFDISTIQGSETVGAMVVNEGGLMQRSEYRKYRIRGDKKTSFHNDFAAIEEVVMRRYRRILDQGGPFPDLVIIDGGKGQLSAAYKAFKSLGLSNLVAISIAKREELIFTRDRKDPIVLSKRSAALRLIQRIRNEAHRSAVMFHRRARAMRDFSSDLDAVPGIGRRRRYKLLQQFGSISKVRRATREELLPVIGPKLADAIIAHFVQRSIETDH